MNDARPRSSRARLIVGSAAGLMILAWTAMARDHAAQLVDQDGLPAIERARGMLGDHLRVAQSRLRGECRLLGASTMIRKLLTVSDADLSALKEPLEDQRRYLGADVLGLIALTGAPLYVVGDPALLEAQLSRSRIFQAGLSSTSTSAGVGIWGSDHRLLSVAACRLGAASEAVVIVGLALQSEELRMIAELTETQAAVTIGSELVATTQNEQSLIDRLRLLQSGPASQLEHRGTVYWVRADDLGDPVLPARVVWWRERKTPSTGTMALIYLPALLLMGILIASILSRGRAS